MMTLSKNIEKYLLRHAEPDTYPFYAGSRDGIDQVVVIPSLAELDSLFATLASLSRNPRDDIAATLVLCVVNNRKRGSCDPDDYRENQMTLALLKALLRGDISDACEALHDDLRAVRESGLRLACIDASSDGFALPDRNGGVGLARKIGMDKALSLFDYGKEDGHLIYCLDADTRVATDYLPMVRNGFRQGNGPVAATVAYAHEMPAGEELRAAILGYEIYLRYYVAGLTYAASPYAFHTIGSAMIATAEAYATVRGMNRLAAAEDFYFLNKLAKIGPIQRIDTTRVYPSPRVSRRVPFGTGRRMMQVLSGTLDHGYRLYDPRVFSVLRQWLAAVVVEPDRHGGHLCKAAKAIHPLLSDFLDVYAFPDTWETIRKNSRQSSFLRRQFHAWFDGFKTLKLVHYLSDRAFPNVPMDVVLPGLFAMMDLAFPVSFRPGQPLSDEDLWDVMTCLRRLVP